MTTSAAFRIPSRDEAGQMVDRIVETVERLNSIMQRETELIRAALYQRELEAVRAAASVIGRLVPERAEVLRNRLAGLQETLSVNLAVVGTARAVAEDMMRTVADEVSKREMPSVYGMRGQISQTAKGPAPLSLSRRS
jgi:hypothetical protein